MQHRIDDVTGAAQAVRKLHAHLRAAKEAAIERTLPKAREVSMAPHAQTVDEDLDEAAEVCGARLTSFRTHQMPGYTCKVL